MKIEKIQKNDAMNYWDCKAEYLYDVFGGVKMKHISENENGRMIL